MKSSLWLSIIGVVYATLTLQPVHGRPNSNSTDTATATDAPSPTELPSSSSSSLLSTTTVKASEILRSAESRALSTNGTTEELDGPIRKCPHGDDSTLNLCLRQILEDLRPKFNVGVPELNIPAMDPLKISNIEFQHGSGPVKVIATFSNVDVRGLSSYNKSDFRVDTKRRVLDFDLGIAQMQITGNYQLAGNLFFFPIGGSGSFWLNLGGISARGQGRLGAVMSQQSDEKNIIVKKIDMDLDISTIKLHLTNLFNGDALLGNVINNFLNENAKDIFDEIRPQIANQVGEMVSLLANRALSTLSADHFTELPEDFH